MKAYIGSFPKHMLDLIKLILKKLHISGLRYNFLTPTPLHSAHTLLEGGGADPQPTQSPNYQWGGAGVASGLHKVDRRGSTSLYAKGGLWLRFL